ncbi:unnamed protein product, partial [Prorocentrum cordatum]
TGPAFRERPDSDAALGDAAAGSVALPTPAELDADAALEPVLEHVDAHAAVALDSVELSTDAVLGSGAEAVLERAAVDNVALPAPAALDTDAAHLAQDSAMRLDSAEP